MENIKKLIEDFSNKTTIISSQKNDRWGDEEILMLSVIKNKKGKLSIDVSKYDCQ